MSKSKKPNKQKPASGPNLTQRRRPVLKAALRDNLLRRKQAGQSINAEASDIGAKLGEQNHLLINSPEKPSHTS
jgi:hypothetical protein